MQQMKKMGSLGSIVECYLASGIEIGDEENGADGGHHSIHDPARTSHAKTAAGSRLRLPPDPAPVFAMSLFAQTICTNAK